MEDLFKQNLLRLRHPKKSTTFSEALFGMVDWAIEPKRNFRPSPVAETFNEKTQVLNSLERFAQEKLGDDPEATIKIPGGEIAYKPEPVWENISSFKNEEELGKDLSLDSASSLICLSKKIKGKVKIMFVTESFRSSNEYTPELREGFINQFLVAFPTKTAELFSRMISAMKLEEEEVIIYPVMDKEKDISAEVMKVAGFYQPEIIVTLGADATNKILKGQERLAQVHGEFFKRKIENIGTFLVVPLFHPSIIENNQNMKKTAWNDMQKIMRHLKKL